MAKYLVQASFTQQGLQGIMKAGGSARREALAASAKSVGGTLEGFYFSFGESDVCVILDLPGNVEAAAIALVTSGAGAVTTRTTPLLTPEEIDQAVKKSVDYTPPGG